MTYQTNNPKESQMYPQSSHSKQIIQINLEHTFYEEIKSLNMNNIPCFLISLRKLIYSIPHTTCKSNTRNQMKQSITK